LNLAVSYNQPKFCPSTTWNLNATTFATNATVGEYPYGIFVDTNNTVYVANLLNGQVLVWFNSSINLTRTLSGNLSSPFSIFVTTNGDIYVDNGYLNNRVDKWTFNTNTWTPVMSVNSLCFGLFVDINDTLYCSMRELHQVVKKWLKDNTIPLNCPAGIVLDADNYLFIMDQVNHRIVGSGPNGFDA
jgi:hypothetical protein